MPERTAAEVLAEKLRQNWFGHGQVPIEDRLDAIAARLAEDPAITVRTDMEVERFIVERHRPHYSSGRTAEQIHHYLTSSECLGETQYHRIIVRPYSEEERLP